MNEQPEALLLAAYVDGLIEPTRFAVRARAELRRLHAEVEALRAQRDALLEALRGLLSYANVLEMRLLDADGEHRAMQTARAAIAKAEGT
jgi:anti-sigma factor RsiW